MADPVPPHPSPKMRTPLTLQTRLMGAVTGIVSLIVVIIAIITSAALSQALENALAEQLRTTATTTTSLVSQREKLAAQNGIPLTTAFVLEGTQVQGADLLLALSPADSAPSGRTVSGNSSTPLTDAQLLQIDHALRSENSTTVTLGSLGSYRITVTQTSNGTAVVTGLSRESNLRTITQLFVVIALATVGGLLLLAITTVITIRVSLRPLRSVAATATRVANQRLDQGAVSITERVPTAEADPRTETGLVGAAVNTMLDHLDSSLAARQRNEEKMRRFVADASHELRTPLASIRGYSELSLRHTDLPEATHTALERIQAQSLRMTHLVEDLLLLARLDEGRELVLSPIDLSRLAVEGVEDARPTAPDHEWELDVPEESVDVRGDLGRLQQVVTNLLANARTHTPAGTRIAVEVLRDGGHGVLRVRDDGPGIDPAVRETLFARFARGDSSRTRATGGTGLGLAITKAIVDGHGGSIAVESTPGNTVFTVRIPLSNAETPATPSGAISSQGGHAIPDRTSSDD
ncbi:two-component system sensor histidine kinase TcrY [Microbacterium pseudoresistens]|uniref:histidine kinase n=1 Tax=Microbacterium pseudoresistens TaxID=640634 RepID=A0A7Y9ESI2_9MICO|nr:ATP-binding protein [Microbacterium pseudoresistens]NYD53147.1 two-component system OmpR family sensor kinase [Microbacterium pseudoresistens]